MKSQLQRFAAGGYCLQQFLRAVTNTSLVSGFIFRVTNLSGGTGSGVSNNFGGVYKEAYCSGHSSTSLRSFQNHHRASGTLSIIVQSLHADPDQDAVAGGSRIYIQGIGVKTVTDYCPWPVAGLHTYDN